MAQLCVALDTDLQTAKHLIETLSDFPIIFKIGPKLFLEAGSEIIKTVKVERREVFLDLKLHDIPNTVKIAVEKAEDMGVDYLTLHTMGGPRMLEWAVSVRRNVKLIGVTVLTSHGEEYLEFLKMGFRNVKELALYLAETTRETGLDGIVCSAGEVGEIKNRTGLLTIVPGVRLSARAEDQIRVFTPQEAVSEGADIVVMGRDIYRSEDPRETVQKVMESIGA